MGSLASVRAVSDRPTVGPPPHAHVVQFYDDDDFLAGSVATFVEAGLAKGQPVVIIATEAHREAFCRTLIDRGVDIDAACSSGQMALRDARETLESFLIDGKPDWDLFVKQVGGLLQRMARPAAGPIRAYGEMVDLLWRDGKPQDAILLEEFWNDLG